MRFALTFLLLVALAGCKSRDTGPAVPHVVTPTGPATAAQISALTKENAELKAQIDDRAKLSQSAAGAVYGAQHANQGNPDGLPKEAVASNLEEAASALPDVPAEEKLRRERDNARMLAGELAAVKAERGQAISENQALKAKVAISETRIAELEKEVASTKAAAEKERAEAATRLQRTIDGLTEKINTANARANEAEDKARKAALQKLGWVLLGLGALFTIIAAFQSYAVVQTGLLSPSNFLKPLVWAGAAAFCFACYWTLNQPWFKWLVIGGAALSVAAIGLFLYAEWREAKERRAGKVRASEADEAEDTLKHIIRAVDSMRDGAPLSELKSRLKDKMSDAHKALVHELRAEDKRLKT